MKNLTDLELKRELEKEKQKRSRLEAFLGYRGSDRVVRVEEAKEILESQEKLPSIKCNIPLLDEMAGGFRPGEVVVVSGLTGQGKTTLLQTLTYGFSGQNIVPLWFSYEVGVGDLLERFSSKPPYFTLPLETVPSSIKWLESRIWEGKAKFDIRVVFIDHLHFLLSMEDLAKAKSSSLLLGEMMRGLKRIALEAGIVIFLVSHTEKVRPTTELSLANIRDSSFISQEADMVLLIWRAEDNGIMTNEAVLKVDKNRRTGKLGKIGLVFTNGRFYEKSYET